MGSRKNSSRSGASPDQLQITNSSLTQPLTQLKKTVLGAAIELVVYFAGSVLSTVK